MRDATIPLIAKNAMSGARGFLDSQENPKLYAAVESHPNVEKHDVRMGHPAIRPRLSAEYCGELCTGTLAVVK
jgi:hypothetical protein